MCCPWPAARTTATCLHRSPLPEPGTNETAVIACAITNADGRTDAPLIGDRPVPIATDELRSVLGDRFRRLGLDLPEPPLLDVVPLRFGVGAPEGHDHVPLVASPWSYQTYRSS